MLAAVRARRALAGHPDPRAVGEPGGTLIVSDLGRASRPAGRRRPDTRVSACRPVPPQCGHGFENTMWPRADFTTPAPWQCRQRLSAACSRPVPRQARHVLLPRDRELRAGRRASRPRSDSVSAGADRRRARGRRCRDARAADAARRRTDRRRSAPTRRSTLTEKSKPSNPNVDRLGAPADAPPRVVPPAPIRIAQRFVRLARSAGTAAAAMRSPGLMSG